MPWLPAVLSSTPQQDKGKTELMELRFAGFCSEDLISTSLDLAGTVVTTTNKARWDRCSNAIQMLQKHSEGAAESQTEDFSILHPNGWWDVLLPVKHSKSFRARLPGTAVSAPCLRRAAECFSSWAHKLTWHAVTCHDTTPFFGDLPKPRKPAQAKTWNSIKLQSSTQRKETLAVQPEVPHLEKPHATSNQQMHPKESHALTQKDPSHLPPNGAQTYDMHRPALPKLFG